MAGGPGHRGSEQCWWQWAEQSTQESLSVRVSSLIVNNILCSLWQERVAGSFPPKLVFKVSARGTEKFPLWELGFYRSAGVSGVPGK